MTKKEYIANQVDNADNDFVNELLYEHYNNEVKDMTEEEFQQHIKNIYEQSTRISNGQDISWPRALARGSGSKLQAPSSKLQASSRKLDKIKLQCYYIL